MHQNDVDKIFFTQLVIARLGEKELMNWWNIDVAYKLGGAAFLQRLLGNTIAPLAAGEALLEAARLKESSLISEIPDNKQVFSLFKPEPRLNTALKERMRHFKRYPDDIPAKIASILDPEKDWTPGDLADLINIPDVPQFSGTSFGRLFEKSPEQSMTDTLNGIMLILASGITDCEKGNYTLCYYQGEAHASI
ncbi:MAG: BREX-6 system BrxE protein [Bacteroidetes bacterium]|nr:BREX-6 system BrxE protein [Bacteroidota bacterium]